MLSYKVKFEAGVHFYTTAIPVYLATQQPAGHLAIAENAEISICGKPGSLAVAFAAAE